MKSFSAGAVALREPRKTPALLHPGGVYQGFSLLPVSLLTERSGLETSAPPADLSNISHTTQQLWGGMAASHGESRIGNESYTL